MKNKGFTLVELLVVIAIVGILSSVVLASLEQARNNAYEGRTANYKICPKGRSCYKVDSYEKENDGRCVYLPKKELSICGDYTIQKLEDKREQDNNVI